MPQSALNAFGVDQPPTVIRPSPVQFTIQEQSISCVVRAPQGVSGDRECQLFALGPHVVVSGDVIGGKIGRGRKFVFRSELAL